MANETPVAASPATPNVADAGKNIANGIINGKRPDVGAPAKTPVAADPNAGKEKYVVEGREVWLSPEQARSYVQKGIAFEPRVSELARVKTETQAFLKQLATDPMAILYDKRIGHTPESVLERILNSDQISDSIKDTVGKWFYEKVYSVEKMDPKDRAIMERDQKISKFEAEEKRKIEDAIRFQNQQKVNMAMQQVKAQIGEAMKESGLANNDTPLGALMARRVADIMRLGYFQKQTVTPRQAIEKVKQEIKDVQTNYYDSLDEAALVEALGEKNTAKVQRFLLKVVKQASKEPVVSNARPSKNGERTKTINMDDFHDQMAEIKRNAK